MNQEKQIRKIVITNLPRFWTYILFSFLLALLIHLIGLLPPILMQKIIDDYIPNKDMYNTLSAIIWFSIIPIVMVTLSTFYNYKLNVVGRKLGGRLTLLGFEKLIYQSTSYFEEKNSSELAAYCKSEAMKYIVFWIFDIPKLIANIVSGLIVFFILIKINIYIALMLILYIPILLVPSNMLAKKIQKYVNQIVENNAKFTQIINDAFRGIKFIKIMCLEKTKILKAEKINNDTVSIWSRTAAIDNLNGSWTNTFVDTLFTGIIFGGSAVKTISNTNFNFKQQLAEYDKLFSIITMDDERSEDTGKVSFKFNHKISLENVSFSYSDQRGEVLKNFNLDIYKNKWLGIVGKSGAGKTTFFDLILGLYKIQKGRILIDGIPIQEIDINEIRKNITKVSQDTFLFPGTFKDNLLIVSPESTTSELDEVMDFVGLDEFIKSLPDGLDTYIGENGVQLSGGQKQRLGLAQGLLRKSKILLLDEVTSNVDTVSQDQIKKIIYDLLKQKDITVISISHRIEFLDLADEIAMIEDGSVKIAGT